MFQKFIRFSRRDESIPQTAALESYLDEVLQPVMPRPEFVEDLKTRMFTAYEPEPVVALPALATAARRYGVAVMALTGLRAWRGLLGVIVLVLSVWQRSHKAERANGLA